MYGISSTNMFMNPNIIGLVGLTLLLIVAASIMWSARDGDWD